MFELVQFVEPVNENGVPIGPVQETVLDVFAIQEDAIAAGRQARLSFLEQGRTHGWWVVRPQGEFLALWIVDWKVPTEYVLDMTTGQLVEL